MTTVHLVDTGVNNLLHLQCTGNGGRKTRNLPLAGRISHRASCVARSRCVQRLYRWLSQRRFVPTLNELVFQQKLPILGICVGMQMMARRSYEGGEYEGLGWFEGDVVKIQPNDPTHCVFHKLAGTPRISVPENRLPKGFLRIPICIMFIHIFSNATKPRRCCCYMRLRRDSYLFGSQSKILSPHNFIPKVRDFGLRILENFFLQWNHENTISSFARIITQTPLRIYAVSLLLPLYGAMFWELLTTESDSTQTFRPTF